MSLHRLFLALWPDHEVRKQLAQRANSLNVGGRVVPEAHLHLTLAFLGPRDAATVVALTQAITDLAWGPITLRLDRFGYFAGPKVAWIGTQQPPEALIALARQASELCSLTCGASTESQPQFCPHVTLRRFASGPLTPLAADPVFWRADRLVLVESGSGGQPGPYRILAECVR